MMRTAVLAPVFLLLLAGCMSRPEYARDAAAPGQHARDTAACESDIGQANLAGCDGMARFDKCMRARGYHRVIGTGNWGLCHPPQ